MWLVLSSFTRALEEIQSKLTDAGLEYAIHKDYGYLLTCPSGIGTALRAGVHLKLPNLLAVSFRQSKGSRACVV